MREVQYAELTATGDAAPMLLGVSAQGVIQGHQLFMELTQAYRNTSDTNTEITYTFPLAHGAVLMGVEVELNGKTLTGEVTPKKAARARYEEAISEGNSSVMLERNTDGSFTLELGNLMAGETCKITIRYAQTLRIEQGQIRWLLPTTIAPRYGNPNTHLLPHQQPVTDITAEYPLEFSISLMGEMAACIVACPSHRTSYARDGDKLVIGLSQRGYLDRDFILVLSGLPNESSAVVAQDEINSGQLAVLSCLSPKGGGSSNQSISVKILVDCSGSMAGDSIEAAQRALHGIVDGLRETDRFSLSRFGSTVEHRSRGLWSGTSQAKTSAHRWVDNLEADLGGTEMEEALLSTIPLGGASASDILLLTDGEIEDIDAVIRAAMSQQCRVFVVGIGASPAEVRLRRLAAETAGACDFVAPGEDVEPAILRMYQRLRSIRASKLRLEWPGWAQIVWQQSVQDHAFPDDVIPVHAFMAAPVQEARTGDIKLWGQIEGCDGEQVLASARLEHVEVERNMLARLCAYAQYQQSSGAQAQSLAVQYQLVTDDTNYILVHERAEAERAQEMPQVHTVPQMLAAGWGGTGSVLKSNISHSAKRSFDLIDDSLACKIPDIKFCRIDDYPDDGGWEFEIPAFLRRQSNSLDNPQPSKPRWRIDKTNADYWTDAATAVEGRLTPLGLQQWLRSNHVDYWPSTFAQLREIGLGIGLCEWLEFEVAQERAESEVILAFLEAVHALDFDLGESIKTSSCSVVVRPFDDADDNGFRGMIQSVLEDATFRRWPLQIADFPSVV